MHVQGDLWAMGWSGGKDSVLALDRAVRAGLNVRYVCTLYDPASARVRFHGTPVPVLQGQAAALGRELVARPAPWEQFDAVFAAALADLARRGVTGMIFGNIHLADVRAWYEARVVAAGLRHHEPLWGEDPTTVLHESIERGYSARLVSIDTTRLPGSWLGRVLNPACAAELAARPDVDPCGERGEYHTLVINGPLFAHPLAVRPGATHRDGGFALLDVEVGDGQEATPRWPGPAG